MSLDTSPSSFFSVYFFTNARDILIRTETLIKQSRTLMKEDLITESLF